MGRRVRRAIRSIARVAVPIIAAVAAAPVTAAIATSAGLGALGTAATAGVVSGTLQGAAAGMTGGNVGQAMALGALGGAAFSGTQSALSASQAGRQTGAIGGAIQDATIRGASGAVSGGVGAAITGQDVGQGILSGGTQAAGMSLATDAVRGAGSAVGGLFSGQSGAAPTDMGGAGVLAPTAAPTAAPNIPQPGANLQNLLATPIAPQTTQYGGATPYLTGNFTQPAPLQASPVAGLNVSTSPLEMMNRAVTPQQTTLSPLAVSGTTTGVAGSTPQQVAPTDMGGAGVLAPQQTTAGTGSTGLLTSGPVAGVSTSPLEMMNRAVAPQQPTAAPVDMGGAGVLQRGQTLPSQQPASDEPTFLQRVWSGTRETAVELGVEYAARGLLGLFTPDPEIPDGPPMINDIDFINIYDQMSPEEQQLFDNARQEMEQLAETNQELFQERLGIARGLLQEAGYFDPEYFGMMQQRATRTAMAQQERERRREEALSGRTPSDARARQAALDSALAGETAYLQGSDFAQQQRLRTMQAAEGMMPTTGPSTLLQHSGTVAGLMQPAYGRLTDQYRLGLDAFRAGEEQRSNLAEEQQMRDDNLARSSSLYGETFLTGFRNPS